MLFDCISPSCLRKGEELKAPRHASAAATRDGNLPVFPTFMLAVKFRKALAISIRLISKLNRAARATASFYVTLLYTPANIWLKSFPYYCLNPLITYLAFCFRILPSLSLLVFRISFPSSTLIPFSSFNCLKSF